MFRSSLEKKKSLLYIYIEPFSFFPNLSGVLIFKQLSYFRIKKHKK